MRARGQHRGHDVDLRSLTIGSGEPLAQLVPGERPRWPPRGRVCAGARTVRVRGLGGVVQPRGAVGVRCTQEAIRAAAAPSAKTATPASGAVSQPMSSDALISTAPANAKRKASVLDRIGVRIANRSYARACRAAFASNHGAARGIPRRRADQWFYARTIRAPSDDLPRRCA